MQAGLKELQCQGLCSALVPAWHTRADTKAALLQQQRIPSHFHSSPHADRSMHTSNRTPLASKALPALIWTWSAGELELQAISRPSQEPVPRPSQEGLRRPSQETYTQSRSGAYARGQVTKVPHGALSPSNAQALKTGWLASYDEDGALKVSLGVEAGCIALTGQPMALYSVYRMPLSWPPASKVLPGKRCIPAHAGTMHIWQAEACCSHAGNEQVVGRTAHRVHMAGCPVQLEDIDHAILEASSKVTANVPLHPAFETMHHHQQQARHCH